MRLPITTRSRLSRAPRAGLALVLTGLCFLTIVPASSPATAAPKPPVSPPPPAAIAARVLARMTLPEKIGQLFMVPTGGPALNEYVTSLHVGGLLLFGSDAVTPVQGRALIQSAQGQAKIPLLISTDQEGGIVAQMSNGGGVTRIPAPRQYGLTGTTTEVYQDAFLVGRQLKALGVNMDLVPVLDVERNSYSADGSRAYGADPALVARLGLAAIQGYQAAGIAATAKHLLGLGEIAGDLHQLLPTLKLSLSDLNRYDLVPIRAAISGGVDALMVTHAPITALDPTNTPASLSRPIVTGFIRGTLGYRGLIVTDSLSMGGLTKDEPSNEQACIRALQAGNDMALISTDPQVIRASIAAVANAVATGRLPLSTVTAAVLHILTLKATLGLLH